MGIVASSFATATLSPTAADMLDVGDEVKIEDSAQQVDSIGANSRVGGNSSSREGNADEDGDEDAQAPAWGISNIARHEDKRSRQHGRYDNRGHNVEVDRAKVNNGTALVRSKKDRAGKVAKGYDYEVEGQQSKLTKILPYEIDRYTRGETDVLGWEVALAALANKKRLRHSHTPPAEDAVPKTRRMKEKPSSSDDSSRAPAPVSSPVVLATSSASKLHNENSSPVTEAAVPVRVGVATKPSPAQPPSVTTAVSTTERRVPMSLKLPAVSSRDAAETVAAAVDVASPVVSGSPNARPRNIPDNKEKPTLLSSRPVSPSTPKNSNSASSSVLSSSPHGALPPAPPPAPPPPKPMVNAAARGGVGGGAGATVAGKATSPAGTNANVIIADPLPDCEEEECSAPACFGVKGSGRINRCARHYTGRMIDLLIRRCPTDRCDRYPPVFGYPGQVGSSLVCQVS